MAQFRWLAVLALAACEHQPSSATSTSTATRKPRANIASRSSGAPSRAASTPLSVRLVTRPGAAAGTWSVVASVPELALDAPLLPFALPRLCETVMRPPRPGAKQLQRWLTCPGQPPLSLALDGGRLLAGDAPVMTFPSNRAPALDAQVDQPPVAVCGPPSRERKLEISLTRRAVSRVTEEGAPAETKYAFALQVGGDALELTDVSKRPMRCAASRIFAKSTSYEETCSWGEAGARIRVELRDSSVWVKWTDTGYQKDVPRFAYGYRLACGDQPVLRALSVRDAQFRPFGSACADSCRTNREHCDDGCYERSADEAGTLSSEGVACTAACQEKLLTCEARCQQASYSPKPSR